jgi:hypothetical protein
VSPLESRERAHCKIADKVKGLPIASIINHLVKVSSPSRGQQSSLFNGPDSVVLDVNRVPAMDGEALSKLCFGAALPGPRSSAILVGGRDNC